MIDLTLLQQEKGGNPDLVRQSQAKRFADAALVDLTLEAYRKWTSLQHTLDTHRAQVNTLQRTITSLRKQSQPADQEMADKANLDAEVARLKPGVAEAEREVKSLGGRIGNLVLEGVPVDCSEDNNAVLRTWTPEAKADPASWPKATLSHDEVLTRLDGFDSERGSKVAGHRGYFLTSVGVDLNLALVRYGLDFLAGREKPFTKVQTPFFMRREYMGKTAQLEEFDEALYKLTDAEKCEQNDEKYLIATSEQPLSAMHAGEWFDNPNVDLPKRYAGYSTCFRKEAGSAGRDTWGIFRVHQFEKIEQFCITDPSSSQDMFKEMVANSEAFYQSLGLSYRVVAIVSGALNNAAAIKYDLEAYFPFQKDYKELVSVSNCTDYQSRSLEVRCGVKKQGDTKKVYVHMLNGTLCATERAMCCLLENYQTDEGLEIPSVLQPYMGGRTFIPYVKAAPVKAAAVKKGKSSA